MVVEQSAFIAILLKQHANFAKDKSLHTHRCQKLLIQNEKFNVWLFQLSEPVWNIIKKYNLTDCPAYAMQDMQDNQKYKFLSHCSQSVLECLKVW